MTQPSAVRFENLSKTFGHGASQVEAVRDVNLEVEAGQVYGFLGPNGAGKTTTIRMIMSLIRPTTGTAYVFGRDVQRDHGALKPVGALVEDATFYKFLTGRRNLEVLARTGNTYDRARIDQLLDQVGLTDRADSRVQGYSTGMKQRLGMAATLLSDPDLVIFDEPTNGLDPAGIHEARDFIRALAHEQGKTVFLSSHLLTEVEQVCDRVAIINKGEIVREGQVMDLLADHAELRVEAVPLDKAADLLRENWPVKVEAQWLTVEAARGDAPKIVRRLAEGGVEVYQVNLHRQSLEEYFLDATASETGTDDA